MKRLSIVIPMYKEEESAVALVSAVHSAMQSYEDSWELILVDDGSGDKTADILEAQRDDYGQHIRVIRLQRNYGQTAAMQAGIDAAQGDLIATLDGDLQNDPSDIPRMVDELLERDLDLLQGWRKARKDGLWLRKIPSKIANRLIAKMTGVHLNDYGCSLKIYRASVIKQVRLFGEMHRFIPVWVSGVTPSERIGETEVKHHARQFGESKYGISRTFRVIIDLMVVFFFQKFRARPAHFFGYIGLLFGAVGSLMMVHLGFVKFVLGDDIGGRPLLLVSILCIVASVQLLTTGVLAEMLSRVFFESKHYPSYLIERKSTHDESLTWKTPLK